ncbi:MAG TPA: undecaprenyl-diphosphate phosphatase [Solirubrobacteraceae bacterium]|nr:undecaprenyl-diphosphate phosphatase [Solirubrobacteraceae bacterium]
MPRDSGPLPLRQAIALGLAQGPTELLPVSSSGHTALIPWLCGWRYGSLPPESRKSFEVALHAGAGLALAIGLGGELLDAAATLNPAGATVLALSVAPPAVAGYALRGPIERRLGGPRSIAAGLIAGGVAMAIADSRAPAGERSLGEAGPLDGLALGLAQALALVPGVSRSGATLTAARARGFGRRDAEALSWRAALPVILGASALEGLRTLRSRAPAPSRGALAAGGGAAFASTILSARLLAGGARGGRALLPYAIYRCLLAIEVARRLRSAHNRSG